MYIDHSLLSIHQFIRICIQKPYELILDNLLVIYCYTDQLASNSCLDILPLLWYLLQVLTDLM